MRPNLLLLTDSYKVSHWRQYPPNTQTIYSYLESRGGKWSDTVFFGLQYILKEYLHHPYNPLFTKGNIDYAAQRMEQHLGPGLFNKEGWEYIYDKHDGRLPVSIWAIPEGTPVPTGHPLVVICNTDPKCYWLTNYLETLLMQLWYPCTVATQSREMKHLITKYLMKTQGNADSIDFKLHDFGFRGVSSCESAGLGGMAHLINFKGTDTMAAIEYASYYYGADMAGFSIPASEHSTITSWGREDEILAYKNMLEAYPTGIVACVSDSFNIFEACRMWGRYPLRDMILERDGTLVIRPDSGDPIQVLVTGNENVMDILWGEFGGTISDKGYKLLNNKIRVIQGDGVNIESIDAILYAMQQRGYSAENIAFGSGGALLQQLNRDTQKMAFKCSAIERDGRWQEVFKDPITDHGKQSKRGLVTTFKSDTGGFYTVNETSFMGRGKDDDQTRTWKPAMVEVFRDGKIMKEYTFDEVRANAY